LNSAWKKNPGGGEVQKAKGLAFLGRGGTREGVLRQKNPKEKGKKAPFVSFFKKCYENFEVRRGTGRAVANWE